MSLWIAAPSFLGLAMTHNFARSFLGIARASAGRPKQSSQQRRMSLWIAALTSFARNDAQFFAFIPRHCEGVRRTTEAIQSTGVACFYGLPRSLRSLSWISLSLVAVVDFASLPSTSHSLTGLAPFSRVVRTKIRRNDTLLCTFSPRHCEGVRRTTEAIQSPTTHVSIDCRAAHYRRQKSFSRIATRRRKAHNASHP